MAAGDVKFDIKAVDKTSRAFGSVQAGLGRMAKSVFSLRTGMAALVGAGGLGLLVKKSLDAADNIGKTADSIGITTSKLQQYRHAAALSGVTTQNMDGAFQAFGKRLGELRAGTGTLVTFLDKFDKQLKANLISAGSTGRALDLMFAAVARTGNASDRAALSAAAFGRSAGVSMTRFVKDGAAALAEMREEATRLGLVLDEDLIRNAEETNDRLSTLGRILKTQVQGAILRHADEIGELAESLTNALPKLIDWVKEFANYVGILKDGEKAKIGEQLGEIAGKIRKTQAALDKYKVTETATAGVIAARQARIDRLTDSYNKLADQLKELEKKPVVPRRAPPPAAPSTIPNAGNKLSDRDLDRMARSHADRIAQDAQREQDRQNEFYKKGVAALEKQIEARQKAIEVVDKSTASMIRQAEQSRLLTIATQEGGDAVRNMRDLIDLENEAQRLGIDLTTKRGEAWAMAAIKAKDMENALTDATEATAAYNEFLQTTGDTAGNAVADVLVYGKTWADVARQIGQQIMAKIISSLVSAGVQMGANFVIARTFGAAAVGSALAEGTAVAAAWAPAAALVSLATLGANAAPAAAAIASTNAISMGAAFIPREKGGPVRPGQGYLVGEAGPELFSPSSSGSVVPNAALTAAGGGQAGGDAKVVNINFTITTLDARGVDQLLRDRRGLIVSMINRAVTERGRPAVA